MFGYSNLFSHYFGANTPIATFYRDGSVVLYDSAQYNHQEKLHSLMDYQGGPSDAVVIARAGMPSAAKRQRQVARQQHLGPCRV